MNRKSLIALLALFLSPMASAEMFWSDTSWSLLSGSDYEVGDDEKVVYTLENASGHNWGTTFLFFDRLSNQNDNGVETYGEVLANIDLTSWGDGGFFKRLYITPHAEFGPVDNLLYGVGVSLNIPGAQFFDVTYFLRKNGGRADDNSQITLAWAFPIAENFQYSGFLDATDSSDDVASSTNFTSQFVWDLGKNALDMKPGKLWLGFEYVYWNNKFGIEDTSAFNTDERNANLLLKWHM